MSPVSAKQDRKHGNGDWSNTECNRHADSGSPEIESKLRQQIVLRPRRDTDRCGISPLSGQPDRPSQQLYEWHDCPSPLRRHRE